MNSLSYSNCAALSAPVHNDAFPALPSPRVYTAAPATVTLPARSVPATVWQHGRHVDVNGIAPPLSTPANKFPHPPIPKGDKTFDVRAVTNTFGSVTTVAVPLPTATTPNVHAHVHRAASASVDCDDDVDVDADEDVRPDLHARMLALPIKGFAHPAHVTTTLNSIKVRQLLMPTAMFNAAAIAKVTMA